MTSDHQQPMTDGDGAGGNGAGASGAGSGKPPAIALEGICKSFGPVQANRNVTLRVMPGTIHGIVGENGAGKSTLLSILYGFYQADAGEILVDGVPVTISSSRAAIDLGIGMVHQHFMLVDTMSVLENVMLGSEGGALLDAGERATRAELARLSNDYGLKVDPDAIVGDLSVGQQQRVEILKSIGTRGAYSGAGRADRRSDAARSRPAVRHPGRAPGTWRHGHSDHSQTARNSGRHRQRFSDASWRDRGAQDNLENQC